MSDYLLVAIILLGVSLLIFHLPILWVCKIEVGQGWLLQNRSTWNRYWEIVDYFWISTAVLSLIFLVNDFGRFVNTSELEGYSSNTWWERTETEIQENIGYMEARLEDDYLSNDDSPQAFQWFADAERAAADGIEALATGLADMQDGEYYSGRRNLELAQGVFETFIGTHGDYPEMWAPYYADEVLLIFEENAQFASEVIALSDDAQLSSWEDAMRFFSMYLLAIALGLRLAKVSAKVFVPN